METITEHEVMELSLEKVIETKLVQANVTEQVLAALKEKYAGMTLKAIDDKESYLEIKQAAKECAKVRTLTVKLCTEGRERAVAEQKEWIKVQKKVVGQVAEVEDALDAEIKKFDDEVNRKVAEEKQRQEEAYINRQAILTKMGAVYQGGSFELGDASFEAELVKGASQEVWDEAIVPKFKAEFEKIEAVRIAAEAKIREEREEMERQQAEFRRQQEEFKLQQAEMQRQKDEMERAENEKRLAIQREEERLYREAEFEHRKAEMEKQAEEKRLADIEAAVKREQERQAETARLAEVARQQEEARKAEEFAQAKDKDKWEHFIAQVKQIEVHDMRSGQYRKKMQIAKEKIDEILAL